MLEIRNVPPSGSALATAADPIRPPAPPLFSTKKFWPNLSVSCSASRRASVSDVPPGANGDTIRTGFAGQSAAPATANVPAAIATATATATSPRLIANSCTSPAFGPAATIAPVGDCVSPQASPPHGARAWRMTRRVHATQSLRCYALACAPEAETLPAAAETPAMPRVPITGFSSLLPATSPFRTSRQRRRQRDGN